MNHSTAAEELEIQHKDTVKEHQAYVNSFEMNVAGNNIIPGKVRHLLNNNELEPRDLKKTV